MNWIKFRDQMPPIGKRIVVTRPGSKTLGIAILLYTLSHEEDKDRGFGYGATEEMLKISGGHWLEIPEPPKEDK